MKNQTLSILLSTIALFGVAGLTFFQAAPPAAPAPLAEADDPAPRAPGEVEAEIRALWVRVDELDVELKRLDEEQGKLKAKVDPATEILALLVREKPKLMSARLQANEVAAIATLRNVTAAQAQIQACSCIDRDQDGIGEFAGFMEMSGGGAGRMSRALRPPVLSRAFQKVDPNGVVVRSGYCFQVWLPGRDGAFVAEGERGFTEDSGVDPEAAERVWCAYAWPVEEGSGKRVFFVSQEGDVLGAPAKAVGRESGPTADTAMRERWRRASR